MPFARAVVSMSGHSRSSAERSLTAKLGNTRAVPRLASAWTGVAGAVVLGQLTENAAGQPGEVLCGGFRAAVIGQLRGLVFELALASAGVGQRRLGPRRSQVGELADGAAQAPQHRGVIPPERGLVLARAA